MSNVVDFRSRAYVVIDSGTITSSTDPSDVGASMFFVEYHDDEGSVLQDYAGRSHADAVTAAASWKVPIYDRSAKGSVQ